MDWKSRTIENSSSSIQNNSKNSSPLQYVIEKDGITVERYGPQAGSFPGFQSIETHLQNCLNE